MKISVTRLQLLMAKNLLTQKELAAKAGISCQGLTSILSGRNCKPITIGRLSRALGVKPEQIIE